VTEERRKNKKKRNKHTPFQMRLHSNSLSQPTFCIKYSYSYYNSGQGRFLLPLVKSTWGETTGENKRLDNVKSSYYYSVFRIRFPANCISFYYSLYFIFLSDLPCRSSPWTGVQLRKCCASFLGFFILFGFFLLLFLPTGYIAVPIRISSCTVSASRIQQQLLYMVVGHHLGVLFVLPVIPEEEERTGP
jgi:hypothetical protein